MIVFGTSVLPTLVYAVMFIIGGIKYLDEPYEIIFQKILE